jgi:hypothetical protein
MRGLGAVSDQRFMATWLTVSAVSAVTLVPLLKSTPGGSAGFLTVVVLGALVLALPEWVVVRGRLASAGWWITATVAGVGVAVAAGFLLSTAFWMIVARTGPHDDRFWSGPLPAAVSAAVMFALPMGPVLGQWLLLRRRVRRASAWLVAGLALSLVFVLHKALAGPPDWTGHREVAAVAACLIGGLVYGTVTAPVLLWLLRVPVDPVAGTQPAR